MTPEEEALRRIRDAETTGAVELDLSKLAVNRLPRELAGLTLLQSLNLFWCEQLRDLSPLAVAGRPHLARISLMLIGLRITSW